MRPTGTPSLKDRIMAISMGTTGIALLAVCAVVVAGELYFIRAMLLRQLEVQGQVIGTNCTAALSFNDRKDALESLQGLAAAPTIVRGFLFSADGGVFASYVRPGGPVNPPPVPRGRGTQSTLRLLAAWQPIVFDRETIGIMYLESDLSEMFAFLSRFALFLALVALASFALTSYRLSRLQRGLVAPFQELVALMKSVSEDGNKPTHAQLSGVHEVRALAAGFNEMMDQIRKRTDDLSKELSAKDRAEAALLNAAQQWRTTFDAITDCVCLLDAGGSVVRCNKAFSAFAGAPCAEIVGKNINEIVYPEADAQGRFDAGKLSEARGRALSSMVHRGRQFDVTVDPVAGDEGRPAAFVFIMTDTTEQRALEEHLAQSQKMDAIGTLAGGVAHDFNNILSVILSYSGFLLDEIPPDSRMRPDVEEIKKSAERAAALTRQLLAFSRKQMVVPTAIVVNDLVNNISKMLKRLIGEHITMEIRFETESGTVWMDPSQLEQILVNLVVNARDAMPRGGRLLIDARRIRVAPDDPNTLDGIAPGDYVLVSVTDTGIGMDKELQKRIFEPFFTTKGVGKGTGLGLSMVYGAVKQNGGFVKVDSEPGRGTTFLVYLRRHLDSGAAGNREQDAPVPAGKGELLLLVEDEEPVRRSVKKMLEGNGYRTVEAQNGEHGLALFGERGTEIALVISDVVMPRMGGVEMMRRLREIKPDLRALHMSGYTDDILTSQGLADQSTRILLKPFERDALLRWVRELLDA